MNSSYPNDAGLVNALLANQSAFNWINHTWSHLFLGCTTSSPQVLSTVTANSSGGTFTAGTYWPICSRTRPMPQSWCSPQRPAIQATGAAAMVLPQIRGATRDRLFGTPATTAPVTT